jgi:hypothetical protein
LREVRGGVECVPSRRPAFRSESVAVSPSELARELHELIAALDRRLPRVEQAGEAAIARDAAALRERAVKRLRELDEQSTGATLRASNRSTQNPPPSR